MQQLSDIVGIRDWEIAEGGEMMIPKDAVIYRSSDEMGPLAYARIIAVNAGLKIIDDIIEKDINDHTQLRAYLRRKFPGGDEYEEHYPITLLVSGTDLVNMEFKRILGLNAIGAVYCDEMVLQIEPVDGYLKQVCPALGGQDSSQQDEDGRFLICSAMRESMTLADWDDASMVEVSCLFKENGLAICPRQNDYQERLDEQQSIAESIRQENYKALVFHFLDLRYGIERALEAEKNSRSKNAKKWRRHVHDLCVRAKNEHGYTTQQQLIGWLSDNDVFTTKNGTTHYEESSFSRMLRLLRSDKTGPVEL